MASSTEFSETDFKGLLWFQPPAAAFGELISNPAFAFFPCQDFASPSKSNFFVMARSASVALGEVGQRNWFHVKVLLLEYVSTFLLRLVPILVSHVSSVFSPPALLLTTRFVASLVSFGY